MKRRPATQPDQVAADRKRGFPPVVDERTRLLVLGSLPGARSLMAQRYYGHPQNQFWRLMSPAAGVDLPARAYADRLEALRGAGIGLWDVVASAERIGSLDASIRASVSNDLVRFVAGLPNLECIAFNGMKAAAIGRKALGDANRLALVTLPSSSPAYTLALAAKQDAWSKLHAILNPAQRLGG